jgi:hypothetical protein
MSGMNKKGTNTNMVNVPFVFLKQLQTVECLSHQVKEAFEDQPDLFSIIGLMFFV